MMAGHKVWDSDATSHIRAVVLGIRGHVPQLCPADGEATGIEIVEWKQDWEMLNIPTPQVSGAKLREFCRREGGIKDEKEKNQAE